LLIVVALLGVYTLANDLWLFSPSQYGFAFSMISVGARGLVVYMVRKLRSTAVSRLIWIGAAAIVLHYIVMRVITTNFAL
jgi:hypothetical protein